MRIGFKWIEEGPGHNYTDLFDEELFIHPRASLPIQHEVLSPSGRPCKPARCLFKKAGAQVELDYGGAFKQYNEERDILPGVTRFTFDPTRNVRIFDVLWKDFGGSDFVPCDVQFVKRSSKLSTFQDSNTVLENLIDDLSTLSQEELENVLPPAGSLPPRRVTTTVTYLRNPYVVLAVLRRAAGCCEGCNASAPFTRRKDNQPYLEVHHIKPLAESGSDDIQNAIALCPNCHRRRHYGSEA